MRLLHSVARDQDNTSRAAHANTANRAQQIRPAPAGRLLKNRERKADCCDKTGTCISRPSKLLTSQPK
jgi:hypothetical protein